MRLNELIEKGLIPKDRILYKFLNDITHILVDPNHVYDPEVVELFNSIKYLGGSRTVNFVRGPMWLGTGSGDKKDPQDAVLNLGGPSMFTMQKNSSGYTTKSGVIKPWLLAFQKMCSLGDQTFVKNDKVSVTAVCLAKILSTV